MSKELEQRILELEKEKSELTERLSEVQEKWSDASVAESEMEQDKDEIVGWFTTLLRDILILEPKEAGPYRRARTYLAREMQQRENDFWSTHGNTT